MTVPASLDSRCPRPSTAPTHPSDGVLPEGAVAVRICGQPLLDDIGRVVTPRAGAPVQLLTHGVDQVTAVVRALEPNPDGRACFAVAGPIHTMWFLYPDGDARAVTYDAGGCGDTTLAPGVVRTGDDPVGLFLRLMVEQRSGNPGPGSDRVAHCNPGDVPTSPLGPSTDNEIATATYCPLPDGLRWREGRLARRQVDRLNADLASTGDASRNRCAEKVRTFSVLTGFTRWGDRFRLSGSCFRYDLPGQGEWQLEPATVTMLGSVSLGPYEVQR